MASLFAAPASHPLTSPYHAAKWRPRVSSSSRGSMPTPSPALAFAMLGAVLVWTSPSFVEGFSCSAEVSRLEENATYAAFQQEYYKSFIPHISGNGARLTADPTAEAMYKLACGQAGADWCDDGGSMSAGFISNMTGAPFDVDLTVSLCFPPACCGNTICVDGDGLMDWWADDLANGLDYLCLEHPILCRKEGLRIELSQACRKYDTLEIVLMIGIIVGTGLVACACVGALCRATYVCCRRGHPGHYEQPLLNTGASEESMQRLLAETVTYDPSKHPARSGDSCAICLGDWEPGDKVHKLNPCGHLFHAPCIAEWLRQRTTCPVCRTPWQHE